MLELLKGELKRGRKIYSLEILSLILFSVFLIIGPKITFFRQGNRANYIIFVWLILNAVSIILYAIYDFATILYEEQKIEKDMTHQFLIKIMLFLIFFGINISLILEGNSMSLPLLGLALTYLIMITAKKSIPHKIVLVVLGFLWFGVFFILIYFGYPVTVILLNNIINNRVIAQGLVDVVFLIISVLVLIKALKKVYSIIKKKAA